MSRHDKLFKNPKPNHWQILEKEVVDEIIFRTVNPRDRLMLELMARGAMRVGEVLKLKPKHIEDRKLILTDRMHISNTKISTLSLSFLLQQ